MPGGPAREGSRHGSRSEHLTFLLDPLDATSLVRDAHRVLYRSTNRAGEMVAVSGTVLVPKAGWVGVGSRPVIGYAPGTQGMADRCAPSRQFSEGIEYEGAVMEGLLQRGYVIAMPDYEGPGDSRRAHLHGPSRTASSTSSTTRSSAPRPSAPTVARCRS